MPIEEDTIDIFDEIPIETNKVLLKEDVDLSQSLVETFIISEKETISNCIRQYFMATDEQLYDAMLPSLRRFFFDEKKIPIHADNWLELVITSPHTIEDELFQVSTIETLYDLFFKKNKDMQEPMRRVASTIFEKLTDHKGVIINKKCKKCGYGQMIQYIIQDRALDEPPTILYYCASGVCGI